MTSPDSGSSTCVLFAKFSPDGSLLRTSLQSSLFQQEEPYSEGLPGSGMMRSGLLYELPTLALHTDVNAPSFWPTSRATDGSKGGPNQRGSSGDLMLPSATAHWLTPHGMNGQGADGKQGRGGEFAKQVTNWTTPQAHDSAGGDPSRVRRYGTEHGGANLADDVTAWYTPVVPNGGRSVSEEVVAAKGSTDTGKRQVGLESQSRFWKNASDGGNAKNMEDFPPTNSGATSITSDPMGTGCSNPDNALSAEAMEAASPTTPSTAAHFWSAPEKSKELTRSTPSAHDGRRPGSDDTSTQGRNLKREGENWGTPTSRDYKDGASADTAPTNGLLGRQVIQEWPASLSSPPDPAQPTFGRPCWCGTLNCALRSHRRRLNSLFTVWMMGWPLHWLALGPTSYGRAATESWLSRQRSLLRSLVDELR